VNESLGIGSLAIYGAAGASVIWGGLKLKQRIALSLAKHPSLAGHPRNALRIARWLPNYRYDDDVVFAVDGAPTAVANQRRAALDNLINTFRTRYAMSLAMTAVASDGLSDLQFVSAYRIPFQFRSFANKGLKIASFVAKTSGVTVTDLDGNTFYDLTGSYGVNLFGNDFYKDCIRQGAEIVGELGPVLGAYHPVVADNVGRLLTISEMDEVSFHMSGTEAVMQAVRLARYHTGRDKIVRFCGAYHGWWGDVQPGIGNPMKARDTLTLTEMSQRTLDIIRNRNDISCVLVNPLQAMHPNRPAPSDSALLDSSRTAAYAKEEYTQWLHDLRRVCDQKRIALILDEVFVGFRLAPGGAQAYFGVRADMVTYGKTLGGGLPIGVLCGKRSWMKRFQDDAPADICFARGTFNSHPYVMGAMNVFLKSLERDEIQSMYKELDENWNARAALLNMNLAAKGIPVSVVNMSTIWTLTYQQPGCYNWLFQHYLRLEGLALSWVGTGRIIFAMNFTDEDFQAVVERFVRAGERMKADGWWWTQPELTNKSIKRRVLRELITARFTR
jgi:glutamate-1-semialdehyde 2,1-aminomutase